jgi:hypothetical protein
MILERIKEAQIQGKVEIPPFMKVTKLTSECGFARQGRTNKPSCSVARLAATGEEVQAGALKQRSHDR